MSLEQTLEQTNALLQQVITILQTGVSAATELGAPEVKQTRARKTKTDEAVATESTYWLIEKHNTVYEQKAGDSAPSIEGAVAVTKEVYDAKKAQFAALVKTAPAAQTQAATAPTSPTAEVVVGAAPEKTESAASQAVASAEAAPQASTAVDFQAVVSAMTALSKSDKPGHGRDGVLAILKKYLPGEERPVVTKLAPLNKNAEIVAEVNALLNAAEVEFDPLG